MVKRVSGKTGTGLSCLALLPVVALVWGVAVAGGCAWWVLPAALCGAGLCILLPGCALLYALKRLTPLPQGFELPLALLLGSGFFAALTCLCARFGLAWPLRVVPPAVALAGFFAFRKDVGQTAERLRHWRLHWADALLLTALLVVYALCWETATAHPAAVGQTVLKQDFLWNIGNARSFWLGFPPQDIRFAGVRLHYHYLNELLAAGLSAACGASVYDLLGFVWPPLVLAAALAGLRGLGRLFYEEDGEARARRLAAFLPFALFGAGSIDLIWRLFSSSGFETSSLYHYITNVNACGTALLFSSVFLGLVLWAMRRQYRVNAAFFVLTACCTVVLCFAKGPVALILALAFAAALLWQAVQKKARLRGILLAGVVLLTAGGIYFAIFSSGANNMALTPDGTLLKSPLAPLLIALGRRSNFAYYLCLPFFMALHQLCVSPVVTVLYAGCLWRDVRRLRSLDGPRLLLHAGALGGMLAYYLFDHYAMSQIYFLYLSQQCSVLLGVELLFSIRRPALKRAAFGLGVFCALSASAAALALCGDGVRLLATRLDDEPCGAQYNVTAGNEAAAQWLGAEMPREAVFATNRYYDVSPEAGNSNLYTALSGRQAYMEGFLYAVSNMGVPRQWVEERFTRNAVLFSPKSDPATVLHSAREAGISYLVFDEAYAFTGKNGPQFTALEKVYDQGGVQIYRVPQA